MTPDRIKWLLRKAGVNRLNEWERKFIGDIQSLSETNSEISEKQALTLENIANKPFLVKRYFKNKISS